MAKYDTYVNKTYQVPINAMKKIKTANTPGVARKTSILWHLDWDLNNTKETAMQTPVGRAFQIKEEHVKSQRPWDENGLGVYKQRREGKHDWSPLNEGEAVTGNEVSEVNTTCAGPLIFTSIPRFITLCIIVLCRFCVFFTNWGFVVTLHGASLSKPFPQQHLVTSCLCVTFL